MKTTVALLASLGLSHAFVALPLPGAHACRASSQPRMLFGGGGKEAEGGGQMNMMETIKKAQQARSRRPGAAAARCTCVRVRVRFRVRVHRRHCRLRRRRWE